MAEAKISVDVEIGPVAHALVELGERYAELEAYCEGIEDRALHSLLKRMRYCMERVGELIQTEEDPWAEAVRTMEKAADSMAGAMEDLNETVADIRHRVKLFPVDSGMDLPEGAEVVDTIDFPDGTVIHTICHPSFEPVPPGAEIPLFGWEVPNVPGGWKCYLAEFAVCSP